MSLRETRPRTSQRTVASSSQRRKGTRQIDSLSTTVIYKLQHMYDVPVIVLHLPHKWFRSCSWILPVKKQVFLPLFITITPGSLRLWTLKKLDWRVIFLLWLVEQRRKTGSAFKHLSFTAKSRSFAQNRINKKEKIETVNTETWKCILTQKQIPEQSGIPAGKVFH